MKNTEEHLSTLKDIREMMNRSSKFISLSGLSGVFAGFVALFGAYAAHSQIEAYLNGGYGQGVSAGIELEFNLLKTGLFVLFVALAGGTLLTYRKSKKNNLPIWDKTSKNLALNLFIPLATGGIFILALLFNFFESYVIIGPSCLIFYGLALVNAGKYTYSDVKYLGICEITLGLIALFYPGYSLLFWSLGFGILHIIYGSLMYFKYERK